MKCISCEGVRTIAGIMIAACMVLVMVIAYTAVNASREPQVLAFTICLHHTDIHDPHEFRFKQNGRWKVVRARAYRITTDDKRELVDLWVPIVVEHDDATLVILNRLDPKSDYEIVIGMQNF